jgi:hypothetical protein
MPEPIRLQVCPRCRTAIPEETAVCPECGAPQEAASAPPPLDPLQALFGSPAERRRATGALLRPWLAGRIGCLVWAAIVVFGVPLAFGLAFESPLAGLAVPLIALSGAGLLLAGVLVWLLWPSRRDRR